MGPSDWPNRQGTKDPDFRARFKAEVRNRDTWMIASQNGEAVGRVVVLKQIIGVYSRMVGREIS